MAVVDSPRLTLAEKLREFNWGLLLVICCVAAIGLAMLYSAAKGSWDPWAVRQGWRFLACIAVLFIVAMTDARLWLRFAYHIYAICLGLLIAVELAGTIGGGSQRWLLIGNFNLQPSEVMKIGIVLALARYFQGQSYEDLGNPLNLIVPVLMVLAPTVLVMKQPDLGTAMILMAVGGGMFLMAGVRWWKFGVVSVLGLVGIVLGWFYGLDLLKPYQKERILTFFDPERDPTGAGYHIIQSKIAVGSGGLTGKGFMEGSQSQLDYLPEKQTDFIFTMLAEEQGLLGGLTVIGLYLVMLIYGYAIALSARSQFGRLLAVGVTINFFLYMFINMAMVMGLMPVVGVPLPLISYGGTALLTVMVGFGLLISVSIHREMRVGKSTTTMDL